MPMSDWEAEKAHQKRLADHEAKTQARIKALEEGFVTRGALLEAKISALEARINNMDVLNDRRDAVVVRQTLKYVATQIYAQLDELPVESVHYQAGIQAAADWIDPDNERTIL